MIRVTSAVLLAVMFSSAGPIARQADSFTVYGAGGGSCASWTERLKDTALHPHDLHWVFGFVSAAGVFAGVQLKVGPEDIEPYMTKYCQENPQATITTAAANLVGNLRR
jgi:hypothetical protein